MFPPDSAHADLYATLDILFNHPAVPLEHIDSVKNIQCPSDNEISFSFDTDDMFDQAKKSWPTSGNPFLLIDGTEGCGKSNERTFFLVRVYTLDKTTRSVKANGDMLSGADPDIVKSYRVDWGNSVEPSAEPSAVNSAQPPQTTEPPSYFKRRWFSSLTHGADSLATHAASGVQSVESAATTKIESVATHAASGAQSIESKATTKLASAASDVKKLIPTGTHSKAMTTSISLSPKGTGTSPFGPAKSLGVVDGVTIYCVECGVQGTLALAGSIDVVLDAPFLKSGSIDVSATNFKIPMVFGFDAQGSKLPTVPFKFTVFQDTLVPFEIPGIFAVGPMITVAVDFKLAVSATGRLKAGVRYSLDNAHSHIDTNQKSGATKSNGWTPHLEKVFELSPGKLEFKSTLGVPISLGFGLDVGKGLFNKNINITDEPSIELKTTVNTKGKQKRFEARNHARDLLTRQGQDQCPSGIEEVISFGNAVNVNVFDVWETQLATFSTPLFSTCIKTDKSGSKTNAPSVSKTGSPSNTKPTNNPPKTTTGTNGAPKPTNNGILEAFGIGAILNKGTNALPLPTPAPTKPAR